MNDKQTNKQINNNNNKYNNNNNNKDNNKHNNNSNIIIKVSIKNEITGQELYTYLGIKDLTFAKKHATIIKMKGIQSICNRTGKTGQELIDEGYTKIIVKIVPTKERKENEKRNNGYYYYYFNVSYYYSNDCYLQEL